MGWLAIAIISLLKYSILSHPNSYHYVIYPKQRERNYWMPWPPPSSQWLAWVLPPKRLWRKFLIAKAFWRPYTCPGTSHWPGHQLSNVAMDCNFHLGGAIAEEGKVDWTTRFTWATGKRFFSPRFRAVAHVGIGYDSNWKLCFPYLGSFRWHRNGKVDCPWTSAHVSVTIQ